MIYFMENVIDEFEKDRRRLRFVFTVRLPQVSSSQSGRYWPQGVNWSIQGVDK